MINLRKISLIIWLLVVVINAAFAKKRVACIGDSVTKGYGIKDSTKSYPYQLQQLLGNDFMVGNFGHSGATLLRKGHNPYHKTKAYQDALSFQPDVIIVALGLNDTDPRNWPNYGNEFARDYTALLDDFRKINPAVEVFICKMTPIFSGHSRFLSGTRDWFYKIQNLLPEIAKANNAKLIDNHAPLAARIDLFDDYLHPNSRGAEILANNVAAYLKPVVQPLSIKKTIGNHMVLQRGAANKIQGFATANEIVSIHFKGKEYKSKADHLGNWEVTLPAQPAGGPFEIKVSTLTSKLVLEDILFGDVFLDSGQSNMAFPLIAAAGADSLLSKADTFDKIRIFKNKCLVETNNVAWEKNVLNQINELDYFSGSWQKSSKKSISNFSAIAYATAVELHKSQGVPIGIIDISVGGSNTESWIPRTVLEHDNLLASYIHSWRKSDFVQDFCRDRGAKNLEFSEVKHQRHPYDPAYNFEAGMSKWTSTNLSGILWYQGESNAHNMEHHAYLFPVLVKSWRDVFQQNLPFYFVQLSSINRPSWPVFRDSQRLLSTSIENVHMAISSDVGHPTDVHPTNKLVIGERLAKLIRQHNYKKKQNADSPQPISYKKANSKLILEFSHCKTLITTDKKIIQELEYVTTKGEVIPISNAILKNNTIIIPMLQNLKSVQYAFNPYTEGNLISDTNVPVSTFNLLID